MTPASTQEIDVLSNGRAMGVLDRAGDGGRWRFTYSSAWSETHGTHDLAPSLPRHQLVHSDTPDQRPVEDFFRNLLPAPALAVAMAVEAGVQPDDLLGLLARFGGELPGCLSCRPRGDMARGAPLGGLQALPMHVVADRMAHLGTSTLGRNSPAGILLGGASPKLGVALQRGAWFEPKHGLVSSHVLKCASPEAPSTYVMNEYFVMRLAAMVGLSTPKVLRFYVPQPVLLAERFDRVGCSSTGRHVLDACQALGLAPEEARIGFTLPNLARVAEYCRTRAQARMQLFTWLVFNLAIGNPDLSLKKISLTLTTDGPSLAPAYGMRSRGVYATKSFAPGKGKASWPDVDLPLAVGPSTTFGGLTRESLVAAGVALGLPESSAAREVNRLARAIPTKAAQLAESIQDRLYTEADACPNPPEAEEFVTNDLRLVRVLALLLIPSACERLLPRQLAEAA